MDIANDPELNGKYLGTITQDFVKVASALQESSYQIRVRKISDYPIFSISKEMIPIGKNLLDKNDLNLEWNYNISFLDEFVQRKIIVKIDEFKQAYKNPDEFCCLFVVDLVNNFNNFVFVPYPVEE